MRRQRLLAVLRHEELTALHIDRDVMNRPAFERVALPSAEPRGLFDLSKADESLVRGVVAHKGNAGDKKSIN
jgi:hypothetical protein